MATKKASGKTAGGTKKSAAKPKANPGDVAFGQGVATLGVAAPGVSRSGDARRAEFTFDGKPYATVERDGDDEVQVAFVMPEKERASAASLGYTKDPARDGWYRIRLGADPRDWLTARVGLLVGTTLGSMRALADAGKWKSLVSGGGPYVVLPKSKVERWGEDGEGTDAERATRAPDTGAVIDAVDGKALVLGTPDPLYFHPLADGGMFVRVVSFDADDEKLLKQHLGTVPESSWSKLSGTFRVDEQLWAFDSANDGVAIGTGNSLQCDLPPGSYAVWSAIHKPDSGTELLLVRLGPA